MFPAKCPIISCFPVEGDSRSRNVKSVGGSEFEFTRNRLFQTAPANFFVRQSIVLSYRFDRRYLYLVCLPVWILLFSLPVRCPGEGAFDNNGGAGKVCNEAGGGRPRRARWLFACWCTHSIDSTSLFTRMAARNVFFDDNGKLEGHCGVHSIWRDLLTVNMRLSC
jgi:hypothetical protein